MRLYALQQDIEQVLQKHGLALDGELTMHITGEETVSRNLEGSRLTETQENIKARLEFNIKVLGEWGSPRVWYAKVLS